MYVASVAMLCKANLSIKNTECITKLVLVHPLGPNINMRLVILKPYQSERLKTKNIIPSEFS